MALIGSAVVALGLAAAFGVVVTAPGAVSLGQDFAGCADPAQHRDAYFGLPVRNEGDRVQTLGAFGADRVDGVRVAGSWLVREWREGEDRMAVGVFIDPTDQPLMPWEERVPVEGAELAPGERASIVLRLELPPGANTGYATELVLGHRSLAGVPTSVSSDAVLGFGEGCVLSEELP